MVLMKQRGIIGVVAEAISVTKYLRRFGPRIPKIG